MREVTEDVIGWDYGPLPQPEPEPAESAEPVTEEAPA